MRRIIERVVTVVTTTTWKISWETDPPSASRDPQADSVSSELPFPDAVQTVPPVIEIKEADATNEDKVPDPTADEPPQKS